MAQELTIEQKLNDLLETHNFHPEMLGKDGRPCKDASTAKTFSFDYVGESGKNYGTMVVILGDDNEMFIMYGDNLGKTMEDHSDRSEFFEFQQTLMTLANRNRWHGTLTDLSKLKHVQAGIAAITEGLFEGYYGNKRVSYAGEPTEARLMLKHNRVLGENDARFRYVESIFIETADGERFKLPFTNLGGGRAMLEHVKQGGKPYDIRGNHICEMVGELKVLTRFNRASASRVMEGVTQEIAEQAKTYYKNLREHIKRMSTHRGYSTYFESWHPAESLKHEELVEDIKTMFIEQTLDTRIEDALPLLARIKQGNVMKEADIFESWIDHLSEGTWNLPETPEQLDKLKQLMSNELIVGPDATNATEQLYDLVGDDILFDRLSALAERDPRANAWNDTEVIRRLEDLGIDISTDNTPAAEAPPEAAAAVAPPAPAAGAPAPPVAEGGEKDRQWSNKDMERLRVATRDFDDIMASDGPDQDKHDLIKKRIQTKPLAGPKGQLPEEQGVAEGSNQEKVEVRFSAKEYAAMSPAQKAAKQEELQQLKQQAKKRLQTFTLIDTDTERDPNIDDQGRPRRPGDVTEGFMDTIKKGYNKTVNALGNIGIMPPELLSPRRDANGNWNKRTNEPRNNFIHWLGGNPALEPHADELLASFDKWVDDGNSDRDAGKHAKDEWQQRMKATKQQGVAEGSVTPNITVNKVHDDGHEKEWHIYRGKEMIGYVIKNQPDTAEGLYIAYGHGPGRAFVKEVAGLKPAVNYIASLKEGMAEGSRIPTLNQLLKTSSPLPKDTYYMVQGSVADEEGRDITVFNIYYNNKSVSGPYYNSKSATRKLHQLRSDGHEGMDEDMTEGENFATFEDIHSLTKLAGIPVAESRLMDSTGETIDHVLNRFKHEVRNFEATGDLDDDLYHALEDYYSDNGDMPYGVMKDRTGDPYEWVSDRLAKHLGMNEGVLGTVGGAMLGSVMGPVGAAAGAVGGQELTKGGSGIVESSCNQTMEGEYCPEHGLMECGSSMYEMSTVAGSVAPGVVTPAQNMAEGTALLARIKSLALIR